MKLSKIILPLFAAAMVLTGCDSFLDIQPIGKVIPTTVPEFRSLMTEAYTTVPDDRGLVSLRSDEVQMDATMSANDLGSYLDIWRWKDDTPDQNTTSFSWRQFYHVLFIANYVIESEDKMTGGTVPEIKQMVGEAYMLRAYMHFILANIYGQPYTACDPATAKAVPLKLDSDVENMLARNTVGEIYSAILKDLDSAEENLNVDSWDLGLNYRFTTLSVDALRSRVLLYMGDWKGSQAAADRVLAVKPELATISNSTCPNEYNSVESIVALEQVFTAQYARSVKVDRDFFRRYATGDLRRRSYFNQVTASNIRLKKGGENKYSCSLRTGELYLNAAEAACRQGDDDAAREYLSAIQKSRYNDGGAANISACAALSGAALLTEILDERTRELAFEGHRWFDLRRTGMPELRRTYGGETFTLAQGDARYTIRIPSEAIAANPGLAD